MQDEEKVTVVQAATNEAKPAAAVEEVQTVNATVGKKPLKGQYHEIFENVLLNQYLMPFLFWQSIGIYT